MAAKVKLTLYFPEEMLQEAQNEAERQDRSISWIVQQAWRLARDRIHQYPSVDQLTSAPSMER
ncbi:MAG: TIGR04563 family protein [Bradymonadales bacterium]|nr:TIGR04563 family protein [Bradymonadales bacterium]